MNILIVAWSGIDYQPLCEASSVDEMKELVPGWARSVEGLGRIHCWTRDERGRWAFNRHLSDEADRIIGIQ